VSFLGAIVFSLVCQAAQSPATQPAQPPQASTIVGEMFKKYYASKSTVGTIVMTQVYDKLTYTVTTQFQFDRKYKIYIKQVSSRQPQEIWLTSSTGQYFCYDVPQELSNLVKKGWVNGDRLLERQVFEGKVMEIGEVYHAASKSLGDRSVPLDIAISHKDDLSYIRNQWKTMAVTGTSTYKNEPVYVIAGDWRPYLTAEVRGKYKMLITMGNELKQYSVTEVVALGKEPPKPITTTWDVDIRLDAQTDPSLYKIYK
jgi:hypothetical protein